MYKNVANFHRLLRTSTVQSTERVKIFPQKFFALKVGLGREELQGILSIFKVKIYSGTVELYFELYFCKTLLLLGALKLLRPEWYLYNNKIHFDLKLCGIIS